MLPDSDRVNQRVEVFRRSFQKYTVKPNAMATLFECYLTHHSWLLLNYNEKYDTLFAAQPQYENLNLIL